DPRPQGDGRVRPVASTTLTRAVVRELLERLRNPSGPPAPTSEVTDAKDPAASISEMVDNIYSVEKDEGASGDSAPFLSVTLLAGNASVTALNDALVALDAQSDSNFELIVVAPSSTQRDRLQVEELLARFSSDLARRSRVVAGLSQPPRPQTRADALRVGFAEARGRYITVLDGTSVVFAHFVETFTRLAHESPAAVLRARAISQPMHVLRWPDGREGFEPTSGATTASAPHFSALEHLLSPSSPAGSFALSNTYFREGRVDIDENEAIVEAAILGGVQEAPDEVIVLLRHFDNEDLGAGSRTD
ncbi:MAG TPA: glycosyltransferase family A protein, partial [Acidimicrobiales bacterium]